MKMSTIHLLFMGLSFLLIIGAIIYSHRQAKSFDGFSVSGRSASRYLVAGNLVGTMVGGSITIGTVQSANLFGLSASWMIIGSALGMMILGVVYAKALRTSKEITIGSYIKNRYGQRTGVAVSLVSSLGIFFSLVASGLSGLHFIQVLFHVTLFSAMTILLLAVLIYVLIGGIKGTGISGIIKTILLYGTLILAGMFAFQELGSKVPFWYAKENFILLSNEAYISFFDKIFSAIVGVTVTQTYAQAIFSARDSKEATYGCYLATLIILPLSLPLLAIGQFMHYYEPSVSAVMSLPYFFLHYLPDWVGGIALGAVFISIIGSISGLSLGAATTITVDVIEHYWGICHKKTLLFILRALIVCVVFSTFSVAVLYYESEILSWNFMSYSLRGAGVFFLLLLAIKGNAYASDHMAPIIVMTSTIVACTYIFLPAFQLKSLTPLDVGLLVSVVLLIGARIGRK